MKLFVEDIGAGPVLLWTHGWTMSHRLFQKQRVLEKDFRLIFWDLPGHGDSEKRASGDSLADCAEALHQLVTTLRLQDVVGIGWSMGADVHWEYLRRFGGEGFRGFVNVESAPVTDPEAYQVEAVRFAFRNNRHKAAEKFVRKMFWHPPSPQDVDAIVAESEKTPDAAALKIYEEIAHRDYRDVAGQGVKLSMIGRHGFYAAGFAAVEPLMPQAKTLWFENSGHMPFWEEAERFNAEIAAFARQQEH